MSHPARGAWIEIRCLWSVFFGMVRGLKYLLCLRVNLNRESHPALWKSQEKSNEKSNDKVPDKVQFSMREPWRKPAT